MRSLPLQLCADQSSVSLPGSGTKKMVLIFAAILVLVGTGLRWTSNSFWGTCAGRLVTRLSALWENFAVGSGHRLLHHPSIFLLFEIDSVRFGSCCL